MKLSSKSQITLNETDRKILNVKPGDQVELDPKTHALVKVPTEEQWAKLMSKVPTIKIK